MNPEFSSAGAPRLQWADAAAKLRFFYAVWPDATARSALAAAAADAARRTGGRPTRTANLHLTLAFVGAVPAERMDTLRTVGVAAAAAAAPCTFCLDHSGTFRDTGTLWLGASTAPPALVGLASALGERLGEAGLRVERRAFRPHVTIVRRCSQPLAGELPAPIRWAIDMLTLVTSELRVDGPRYAVVERWPLAGGDRSSTGTV
ncbi:MAG: RNA 2',3'-cyclic phosphodiesterase [Betaproteobacteria bacterium]|nr:RNA 2',3'-cyclic phosphodiesterase [Betaproteobacteria bacterium]